jgi:hypothetical protein
LTLGRGGGGCEVVSEAAWRGERQRSERCAVFGEAAPKYTNMYKYKFVY